MCSLFPDYEARTQGAFVEKKVSSVTFHYRNADPVFGVFQGWSFLPSAADPSETDKLRRFDS